MEKKQKIAMKKLQFVIVITLGSNCSGVIIRGQYNSPRWELSRGIVLGGNCPRGNCPRWELSGVNCPEGSCLGGQLSRGGGGCPRTSKLVWSTQKRNVIKTAPKLKLTDFDFTVSHIIFFKSTSSALSTSPAHPVLHFLGKGCQTQSSHK